MGGLYALRYILRSESLLSAEESEAWTSVSSLSQQPTIFTNPTLVQPPHLVCMDCSIEFSDHTTKKACKLMTFCVTEAPKCSLSEASPPLLEPMGVCHGPPTLTVCIYTPTVPCTGSHLRQHCRGLRHDVFPGQHLSPARQLHNRDHTDPALHRHSGRVGVALQALVFLVNSPTLHTDVQVWRVCDVGV